MGKTAVFYGSDTGNTESAAKQIAKILKADIFDVDSKPTAQLAEYQNLVQETSTMGHDMNEYEFDASNAVVDGGFVGLPLDEDNQGDLTDTRIKAWTGKIKAEL